MTKIIAVGDIHGRSDWKKVAEKESDFDTFVFVGDYFDNWPPMTPERIVENFKDMLAFKEKHGDKVVLCIGNHDFQYMPQGHGEHYSGYNTRTKELLYELGDWWAPLQAAYQHEDILFTHAGLSVSWVEKLAKSYLREDQSIADTLNEWFRLYPELFRFNRADSSGCGEHVEQGPFWIRPKTLLTDMFPGITQVVGHTGVDEVSNIGALVMLDAARSGEYLKVEDGVIGIGTWKDETLG